MAFFVYICIVIYYKYNALRNLTKWCYEVPKFNIVGFSQKSVKNVRKWM
jgi:hypothetical protein